MMPKTISGTRRLSRLGIHFTLILLAFLYILPTVMIILSSFKTNAEILRSSAIQLPQSLNLVNYREAIRRLGFLQGLRNSIFITIVSVGFTVLISSLAGYALARGRSKKFSRMYILFLGGLLIPYQAIFVPMYLIGSRVGMINTFWGVIFFYIAGQLPFSIFMMTGFMKTVPVEIEQAALIDGCNTWSIFLRVVLPLLKSAATTLMVLRTLTIWNDYLLPRLFLQKQSLQTITVRIANLFGQYRYSMNLGFAAIVLSSIPILVFFLWNQKHIEKGIASGAVKG
jgi:raffinose/stachyose/melibiose transport system permease protein